MAAVARLVRDREFDAPLKTGTGVIPIAQPPESLQALRKVISSYDDFRLTGLSQAVQRSPDRWCWGWRWPRGM